MTFSRSTPPRRRKRGGLRFLFTFTTTTAMIATGGFGAFPDNPLTRTYQEVISQNIPADFLNPFNSYMESISAPQIPSRPASASESVSQPDPLSFFQDLFAEDISAPTPIPVEAVVIETAIAAIAETQTQITTVTAGASSPTVTQVLTLAQTQTFVPTLTLLLTATESLTPTWTIPPVIVYPPSTSTKKPPPANTPTITPSPTDTPTPFIGFDVNTVDVNGMGSYVIVSPGALLNVSYSFNIYNDPCPGCQTQLVTGLGTAGSHGGTCAFDGDALPNPGSSGFEDVILTAPMNPGFYSVVVEYYWETGGCTNALALYGTGLGQQAPSQAIAQVEVQQPIVLYDGGIAYGNIGPRASADAMCTANIPAGYGNARAFIGYSAADSIANLPTNYGVPANLPVSSATGVLIANNWADLLDGNILTDLSSAGVPVNAVYNWWSGAEAADGSHIDGTTETCLGWTSNSLSDGGDFGNTTFADSQWITNGYGAGCYQQLMVLCVGY